MRWVASAPARYPPEVAVSASSNRFCRSAFHAGRSVDHGFLSSVIVTATIGDVITAAIQPTYMLAAICRGNWAGWTRPGHGKRRCLVQSRGYTGPCGLASSARFALPASCTRIVGVNQGCAG